MKIVRAMKAVKRLQGEVKDLQHRLQNCVSTLEENDFPEDFNELLKTLIDKKAKVIEFKTRIMKTNIKYNMFPKILELGELKSHIQILKELNPVYGLKAVTTYGDEGKATNKYKAQMTIAQKNKLIENCQGQINEIVDGLDEFNLSTVVEEL